MKRLLLAMKPLRRAMPLNTLRMQFGPHKKYFEDEWDFKIPMPPNQSIGEVPPHPLIEINQVPLKNPLKRARIGRYSASSASYQMM